MPHKVTNITVGISTELFAKVAIYCLLTIYYCNILCNVQLFTKKSKFGYNIDFQREKKCQRTIPVQTETLSECLVPA